MTFYEKLQELCDREGISISNLGSVVPGLKISKASITGWKAGSKPRPEKLKALAEYFNVSIEYLIDESAKPMQTVNDNHGIIGNTHAPVTIINDSEHHLSEQAIELLGIFDKLSIVDQAKLLVYANELKENSHY